MVIRDKTEFMTTVASLTGANRSLRLLGDRLDDRKRIRSYSLDSTMKGEAKRHWTKLCEQAANEQDSTKLMKLVEEITRLLDEKETRLRKSEDSQG